MRSITTGLLSLSFAVSAVAAHGAEVVFNNDPFAGSTALTTPGRQVNGLGEVFLTSFDVAADVFAFEAGVFGVSSVSFVNSLGAGLPTGRVNVVVLQDTDNDSNAATAFNAGAAANLIAAALTESQPGFFVYWNSSLNVNRLVYSTDLSDPAADLSILARINSPTGAEAIAALSTFGAANFAVVPEPASAAILASACLALFTRRRG